MSSLSKEDNENLRLLVQHVARAFYEPKFTIVLDQLIRHPVLKDDDLAGRMGLQLKELNKVMAVLENHKLVRIYRQNELKEGAQRSVGRQYFYIDYEHFCNVVKWRVAEMFRRIDTTLRNELDSKGYICPQCGKSFSPLEADKVLDFVAGTFNCDICRAELVDNENAESVKGSQDRMQRFNRQMRFVMEGLKRTEDMVLPAFDVAQWVKTHIIDAERAKAAAQPGGLKIAGSSGDGKQGESIGIVLSVDKDEATRRAERDKEAAAKRLQNVLPAWHLRSTISGDLTALGIKENAKSEVPTSGSAAVETLPSSNDAILQGLGKPTQSSALLSPTEDIKPVIIETHDADYYDQYYATLAASRAPSSQDTPAPQDLGSDFGDEDDVKPAVEYLDSLNQYRKRSRSVENVGSGSGSNKVPKLNGGTNGSLGNPQTGGLHGINGVNGTAPSDEPIIYVNGEPVPFSLVTEEQQELMTPEEYTAYCDIVMSQS